MQIPFVQAIQELSPFFFFLLKEVYSVYNIQIKEEMEEIKVGEIPFKIHKNVL